MTNVMKSAWSIAYEGVAKFGGEVKEYFAEALRIAWDLFKKGGKEVNNGVKGTIAPMQVPSLEGTEKQIEWANKIRMKAVATLRVEVGRETRTVESMLPNGRPEVQRVKVENLLGVLQSEENINAHLEEMKDLPIDRIESKIETLNGLYDRYNRFAEILSNADAKFWIDNRDNEIKNHDFNKFIAYVNTGVKEF